MATITTRVQGDSPKGSPLTNAEVDNNFINLNTAKYESGDSPSFGTLLKVTSGSTLLGATETGLNHYSNNWLYVAGGSNGLILKNQGLATEYVRFSSTSSDFNDDGVDRDFRVESDSDTNCLFVDGGSNRVGIKNGGPISPLHINAGVSAAMHIDTQYAGGSGGSTAYSNPGVVNNLLNLRTGYAENAESNPNDGMLWGIRFTGYNGSAGSLTGKTAAVYARSEDTGAGYNRTVGLEFQTSSFDASAATATRITGNKTLLHYGAATFNEDSGNFDFRVESDTNSNGLFFDASASALGINKQPDATGIYALDIDGVIRQKSGLVAGIVYPYSGNAGTRVVGSGQQWYKIWESPGNSGSPSLIKIYLHCGGDNTAWSGEFLISLAGYNFSHSIELLDYQYYNTSKLLEIRTFNTGGGTDFEVWVKLDAITSSAGNLITSSNSSYLIETPVAGTLPSNTIGTTALTVANWPSNSARSAKALSENLSMGNGAEIRLWRPEETRYSRIYHSSAGGIFETQNSGDNLYLRNSAGSTGNVLISNGYDGYEVAINDGSYNTDFRVESDGNSHCLFVDGSANKVGINTSNAFAPLSVYASNASSVSFDDEATTASLVIVGTPAKVRLQLGTSDGTTGFGPYAGWIQASYDNGGTNYGVEPLLLNPYGGRVDIGTGTNLGGLLNVAGSIALGGGRESRDTDGNGSVGSNDALNYQKYTQRIAQDTFNSGIALEAPWSAVSGSNWSANKFRFHLWRSHSTDVLYEAVGSSTRTGDGDAFVFGNTNTASGAAQVTTGLAVDGPNMYLFGQNNLTLQAFTGVTVNEQSANADFRVESDYDSHALFVDADVSNVAVGANGTTRFTVGTDAYNSYPTGRVYMIAGQGGDVTLKLGGYGGTHVFTQFLYAGNNEVGRIYGTSSGITYQTTSDRRLKENIEAITDGTEKLMAMRPVTHTWKNVPDAPAVHGFIAQEMQEIVPEAVSGDPTGEEMMAMDYGRITPVLVAALQDAHKKIAELEARLTNLEAR